MMTFTVEEATAEVPNNLQILHVYTNTQDFAALTLHVKEFVHSHGNSKTYIFNAITLV